MRLTLRTLLAYLDDTLQPHEIKDIGQKVAESDAAQELIARIKQVTRRRRLTTPPATGPGAKFDPNTIAEYLDNELSTELVAELEKTCLESDVHLAEVASCHQILTLVLGEPALVPPTARERMYGLVKGREAIPFRKARGRDGAAAAGDDRNGDDPLLPFLPASRGWLIWALPLAAALVLAALAIALWEALPDARPAIVAAVRPTPPPPPVVADVNPAPPAPPVTTPAADNANPPPVPPPVNPMPPTNPPVNPMPPTNPPTPAAPPDERPKPPSTVRVSAGRYVPPPRGEPTILVQRQSGQPAWKRLIPGNGEVFSTDDLVSLPGYNSELALGDDGGTHLLLHGHLPQFTVHPYEIMDFLLESAVRLNKPEAGFDADVTLLCGRIYLSNRKAQGASKVRLRFADEVWDLTLLQPDTEAGVDLLQGYTGDINYRTGESPLQEVYLNLLAGRADIRIDSREFANKPAPFVVHWDNKGPGASPPQPIPAQSMPAVQAVWSKSPPAGATDSERASIQDMIGALDGLAMLMTNRAVDASLLQARETPDNTALRLLAVYSFGAIDDVNKVLDVLCSDGDPAHAADRSAAVFTMRRWLSRGADKGPSLYDEKKETGLLLEHYHFRGVEARDILTMLYDFPSQDARQKATFEKLTSLLRNNLLPIRELAYWHLRVLSVGARVALPPYNAGWTPDQRDMAANDWRALIEKNELPPPPPMAPPAGKP